LSYEAAPAIDQESTRHVKPDRAAIMDVAMTGDGANLAVASTQARCKRRCDIVGFQELPSGMP
jgi:hypothetical protein